MLPSHIHVMEMFEAMGKCNEIGHKLEKRDYKEYGFKMIILGYLSFPLMLIISHGLIIPLFALILFSGIGLVFILKKDRYFYLCVNCGKKIRGKGVAKIKRAYKIKRSRNYF